MDTVTDPFRVEFEGKASRLRNDILSLYGIESMGLDMSREEISGEFRFDISYDGELTDRTLIAQQIEEIDGVGEVGFA